MKRGDVYWADLNPRSGSEQKGKRPVVIISHDGFNLTPTWRSVVVVPISTSPTQASRGPTVVAIAKGIGGLNKDSVALCHQVTTLDRIKLTGYLGNLPLEILKQVEEGLKSALDLT